MAIACSNLSSDSVEMRKTERQRESQHADEYEGVDGADESRPRFRFVKQFRSRVASDNVRVPSSHNERIYSRASLRGQRSRGKFTRRNRGCNTPAQTGPEIARRITPTLHNFGFLFASPPDRLYLRTLHFATPNRKPLVIL